MGSSVKDLCGISNYSQRGRRRRNLGHAMSSLLRQGTKRKLGARKAYYFTTHLAAKPQAKLVLDVTQVLLEAGILVHALTFVEPAEVLGAGVVPGQFKNYFDHPVTGHRIYIMIDPPHMLKLARNHFADASEIKIPGFAEPAKWAHVAALHDYQTEIGFRALGNKLTKKHVNFQRHKMKVSLAAQVLSSSVADALQLVKELPQFSGCNATSEFCRQLDRGFDLLNSRSRFAKGDKSPITVANFLEKEEKLMKFFSWLRELKLMSGKKMEQSQKKTFIIGFCTAVLTTLDLAKRLLFREDDPFPYLNTHFLQQDFVEHYFGKIRRKGGAERQPYRDPSQIHHAATHCDWSRRDITYNL